MAKSSRGGKIGASSSGAGGGGNSAPALDRNLIRRANEAGFATDIGDVTVRQYNRNVDEINATVLSDSDKAEAIARLHQLTNAQLEAESSVINPLATGRGVARFDRQAVRTTGDKALDARREVREFMESVHAKERDTIAKRAQQAMTTAMSNALANGSLEFTVNGATYRRKSKRSRSFERVYG